MASGPPVPLVGAWFWTYCCQVTNLPTPQACHPTVIPWFVLCDVDGCDLGLVVLPVHLHLMLFCPCFLRGSASTRDGRHGLLRGPTCFTPDGVGLLGELVLCDEAHLRIILMVIVLVLALVDLPEVPLWPSSTIPFLEVMVGELVSQLLRNALEGDFTSRSSRGSCPIQHLARDATPARSPAPTPEDFHS